MAKYVYLKEPGILYDMFFLMRLYFNGERAYKEFENISSSYDEDIKYYKEMSEKCSGIDTILHPFFHETNNTDSTFADYLIRKCWDRISLDEEHIVGNFYALIRDSDEIVQLMMDYYFPELKLSVHDSSFVSRAKKAILASELPGDVKLYMYDYIRDGKEETDFMIVQLKKVQTIVEESYQKNIDRIRELKDNFVSEKNIAALESAFEHELKEYDVLYYTYCTVFVSAISLRPHKQHTRWIAMLGIESNRPVISYTSPLEIDLKSLGQVMSDHMRVKILDLFTQKEMYCAQVARAVDLKNNSTIYHLSMMNESGILKSRMAGNKVLYSLNEEYLVGLKKRIDMMLDRKRLTYEDQLGNSKGKNIK